MLLKYNIKNIKHSRRILNKDIISKVNVDDSGDFFLITVETFYPYTHNFKIGDAIIFNKDIITVQTYTQALSKLNDNTVEIVYVYNDENVAEINAKGDEIITTYKSGYYGKRNGEVRLLTNYEIDRYLGKYNSLNNDKLVIIDERFDDYKFTVSLVKYKTFYTDRVIDGGTKRIVHVKNKLPFIMNEGDLFEVTIKEYCYQEVKNAQNDNYFEVDYNPNNSYNYIGYDYIIFNNIVFKWTLNEYQETCTYLSDEYFECGYGRITENNEYYIKDNRFIDNSGNFINTIKIIEYQEYITLSLPLSNDIKCNFKDENDLKLYFNEKKEELISEIKDYEKFCFTPYYKNEKDEFTRIEKIKYNLYFRDRQSSEDWVSNDGLGWNLCKINENGEFVPNPLYTEGDLLGCLNFTDEDAYYQKQKLSKSFLRLSFYNTNDPTNQMLLYYTTIYLDTNEIYTKYVNNLYKKYDNPDIQLVNNGTLGKDCLTASFTVNDKFDKTKCSEGFYLYLFPDGIKNGDKKTIYMKAEFNHAGYGRTVPFILPHDGTNIIDFQDVDFPFSLIDLDNGDLSKYYKFLHIPVTIEYNEDVKDFIYYFKYIKRNNNDITINLFEPKINPID